MTTTEPLIDLDDVQGMCIRVSIRTIRHLSSGDFPMLRSASGTG